MSAAGPLPDGVVRHFSIHNQRADVAELLTAVRDHIASLGAIEVFDICFTLHHDGPDFVAQATVYYHLESD